MQVGEQATDARYMALQGVVGKAADIGSGFRWRRSLTISMTKLIIEYLGDPEETYEE